MTFRETPLAGAFVIEPERIADERGFFARTFCQEAFASHGLEPTVAQANVSFNHGRGTLRGLHFQRPPHAEAKLVRVTAGAIFDAIVDLRPGSPTFRGSFAIVLSAENRLALYVPRGFAHGFQTLVDASEVFYQMSTPYHAPAAAGYRYDDPTFGLDWPLPVSVVSDRDRALPLFAAP